MFTELLENYKDKGLKALKDIVALKEEPTEGEFNNEIDIAQKKSEGKIRNKKIDNAAVQAVEIEGKGGEIKEEKDSDKDDDKDEGDKKGDKDDDKSDDKDDDGEGKKDCNESESAHKGKAMWGKPSDKALTRGGRKEKITPEEKKKIHDRLKKSAEEIKKKKYTMKGGKIVSEEEELEERTLSSQETDKKERIVKSLKKKMKDFKSRYGDKAKNVMYAVATKQAKKDD